MWLVMSCQGRSGPLNINLIWFSGGLNSDIKLIIAPSQFWTAIKHIWDHLLWQDSWFNFVRYTPESASQVQINYALESQMVQIIDICTSIIITTWINSLFSKVVCEANWLVEFNPDKRVLFDITNNRNNIFPQNICYNNKAISWNRHVGGENIW